MLLKSVQLSVYNDDDRCKLFFTNEQSLGLTYQWIFEDFGVFMNSWWVHGDSVSSSEIIDLTIIHLEGRIFSYSTNHEDATGVSHCLI